MKPLSSFELIVQPLIPQPIAKAVLPDFPNPVSIQAYFLTLSNYSDKTSNIELSFIANPRTDGASTFNGGGIVPLEDNDKNFGPVSAFINFVGASPLVHFKIDSDSEARATFAIPSLGTALFLLQPDVSPLRRFDKPNENFSYQLRGLVNIDATAGTQILCTPQIRGTFLELEKIAAMMNAGAVTDGVFAPDIYAQQAYPLPTAQNALYSF